MSGRQRSNGLKAGIVIVLSLAVTLVLAELSLRILEPTGLFPDFFDILSRPKPPLDTRSPPGMYYAHPYSAYGLKPGYRSYNEGGEYINALGFRGEEIDKEKPEGTFRIVAMGGSTTFAVYLKPDESYPYFLQRELRQRLGTDRIEVVNAGLTGSTSAESLHRLFYQILPVDPDMVVIYHGYNDLLPRVFNDWQDDYYHFRRSDPSNPPGMTRFYIYRLALRGMNPSAFASNYDLMHHVWKTQNLPETDTERTRNFRNTSAAVYESNLENIILTLTARGIQVVLATFAIHPDIWHWNDYIPPHLWEVGIRQNNEAIGRLAERYGVALVPFAEAPGLKRRFYSDSIHMTPEGNQLKASIFADTIAPIVSDAMGLDAIELAARR